MDSSRSNRLLTGQRVPSETFSDDLAHGTVKAFKAADLFAVLIFAVVVPVHLLVQVPKQVEGLDADVGSLQARLTKLQKFSIPLVWTLPRTYSIAWLMTLCSKSVRSA